MSKENRLSISSTIKNRAQSFKYFRNQPYFGYPSFVQIELTTKCNLRCEFCLRTSDPDSNVNFDMSFDLFASIIRQLKGKVPSISLVGLGEPLLHQNVFSMIRLAKDAGLEVSVIDNFTLINREKSIALIDSGLDYLYVSFDHINKKDFEERRTGACFEEVLSNIRLFLKTRREMNAKKPIFFFKSTIASSNFSEVPKLIKFAEELGADGINFGKMVDWTEGGTKSPPILDEIDVSKSKIAVDLCEISRSYVCDATRGLYITFDGRVLPCGLMAEWLYRADYPRIQLGDLTKQTIKEIWRSKKSRKLRKDFESGKHLPECRTCGGVNSLLDKESKTN